MLHRYLADDLQHEPGNPLHRTERWGACNIGKCNQVIDSIHFAAYLKEFEGVHSTNTMYRYFHRQPCRLGTNAATLCFYHAIMQSGDNFKTSTCREATEQGILLISLHHTHIHHLPQPAHQQSPSDYYKDMHACLTFLTSLRLSGAAR